MPCTGQTWISPAPSGPPIASRAVDPDPHDGEIHVWPVQGNVYLLIGGGGNTAVQVGENGALVVDTGTGQLSGKTVAAIRTLAGDKPIQYVVNTSFRPEHTEAMWRSVRLAPIPA